MAQKARKKTTKQQPAKDRLLLLRAEEKPIKKASAKTTKTTKTTKKTSPSKKRTSKTTKSSAQTTRVKKPKVANKSSKKVITKKPPAKQPVKAQKKVVPAKKKVQLRNKDGTFRARKKTVKKQFVLPISRQTKLVLGFQRTQPVKKRSKRKTKAQLKQQRTTAIAIIILGLFGAAFFSFKAFMPSVAPGNNIASGSLPNSVNAERKNASLPMSEAKRITIPDVQIDTEVQPVGLEEDGSIEVPANYRIAGQYRYGPTPGEIGPSIIVGHLDNIHGEAVFWRIRQLKEGQIIKVAREDGKTAQFQVDAIREYSQNNFPAKDVYGNIDYAGLRLITCGGTFNRFTQRYSDNTVVFASLIVEKQQITIPNTLEAPKQVPFLVSLKNPGAQQFSSLQLI